VSNPQIVNADGSAPQHESVPYGPGEVCPFATGPMLMPRIMRGPNGEPMPAAPSPIVGPTPCLEGACKFWHATPPAENADDDDDAPAEAAGDCIIKTSLMFVAGQAEQQTMLLDDVVTALEYEGILGPVNEETGERDESKKQKKQRERDEKPAKAPEATDPIPSPGDADRAAELKAEKEKRDAATTAAPTE
jgi:hypothetical protein